MNIMRIPSVIFLICCLALTPASLNAQSVSLLPITRTSFCAGDSIAVSFVATGAFGHKNAFSLQLSDPSGSFTSGFQNLGSLFDTLPGTFTINTTIPANISSSTQYRFRILAAVPYITSADNGSEIAIGTRPGLHLMTDIKGSSIGTVITFTANLDGEDLNDTAFWDFGTGATPATAVTTAINDPIYLKDLHFSQDVTYSSGGAKTVTLSVVKPGGCSTTGTFRVHIFDCTIPSIPHDAIVIDSDATVGNGFSNTYWVNPGVTVTLVSTAALHATFFAEPGSTITGSASNCTFYMKRGSVLASTWGQNSVIFGDGASIHTASNDFTLSCGALDFDYTNAPPNAAHPLSVKDNLNSVSITLSPNPTTGMLSVQGLPSDNINVSVFNLLGEMVMVQKNPQTPDFTLDLSKLSPGTYYIRFSSANSVVTKKIIKN